MARFFSKPSKLSPTAKSWEQIQESQDLLEQTNSSPNKDNNIINMEGDCQYEEKMLLVSGLSEQTTIDTLWNYLKERIGTDVERVAFLGQGRAVVDLSSTSDFQNLKWTALDGMQLTVERIYTCNSVIVSGVSPEVTKDDVLLYFGDVHCSVGGRIKDVKMFKETQCAVVTFANSQVADKVAGKRHFLNGNRLFVEKYFPQIDCQGAATRENVHRKDQEELHKDIIMQFITNGGYAHKLEAKLDSLASRIQWSPTNDLSRIWQMANSAYLNQWARSYQIAVHEFLDQFETLTIPVEKALGRAVDEALPQLVEMLPKEKALCKKDVSKQEILVGCLKSEKKNVSELVHKFVEIVRKETYKKETVTILSRERMLLLKKIEFVDNVKEQHSELEATLYEEKCELYLEGPCEEFNNAKNEYSRIMNEVVEETYTLPYTNIGKIVKSDQGQKYLSELILQEKVSAIISPLKGNAIRIMATNSNEYEKAKNCLGDSMKWFKVPFESENTFIVECEKWEELFTRLKEDQLLEICIDKSTFSVVLYGVSESVADAKHEVENFIEAERIRSESQKISKGMGRFLKEQFLERVKDIEERLKNNRVSIKISQSNQVLFLKGTQEGLAKCKIFLRELYEAVVTVREEFSSPGLAKLFYGEKGQRHTRLIETKKKVVIEVVKTSAKHGKVTQNTAEDHQKKNAVPRKRRVSDVNKPNVVSSSTGCGSPYDRCNFSTKEGLKVSLKFGNIANERVDVLVNFTNSNLNQPAACGKSLNKTGGPALVEASNYFGPSRKGSVVNTVGGNLACSHVLHAVRCKWDNGQGSAERILRHLVKQILDRCVQLGAQSLAIPTIGTHEDQFPETLALQVLREEIEKFSTAKPLAKLKDIRIVVSAEETACKSTAVGFRTISFGSVSCSLRQGDITQHPVDAIINLLPHDLQLSKGGGVCKRILQVGGRDVQKELNASGKRSQAGSVLLTSAGSITNVLHILHFVPTSTDCFGFQRSVEECFIEAKSQSLSSISIAAIGTGAFHIAPRDSANLILCAAKNFSNAAYSLDVNIVVFQKSMMPDFETVIQEKEREYVATREPLTTESSAPDNRPQPIRLRSSRTRAGEIIMLDIFAHSPQDIDRSLDEVNKFVREHTGTNTIKEKKVCHLLMKFFSEVENLERVHDVSITCQPPSSVSVSGMLSSVDACIFELWSLINEHVGKDLGLNQIWCTSDYGESTQFQKKQSSLEDEEVRLGFLENSEAIHYSPDKQEWNKKNQETDCGMMLEPRHIEHLSQAISNKWARLARLLNIPKDVVHEIQQDMKCRSACSRAVKIIETFNSRLARGDAAVSDLIHCLHEIRVKVPECLSATLEFILETNKLAGRLESHQTRPFSGKPNAGISSLDGNPHSFKNNFLTQKAVVVSDSTPLSQREIERLSREISVLWRPLANLLELPRGDIDNLTTSLLYPNPTDKAVEVLQLYNDDPNFRRAALGEFLDELNLLGLKEKVANGILRKSDHLETNKDQRTQDHGAKLLRVTSADLPAHWEPQPQGQNVHVVSLPNSSAEYEEILKYYSERGGSSRSVLKIERIQNPGLYKAFLAKKQSMNEADNEMLLFHGTSEDNIVLINANNFNRNCAGINGETYGKGVYFARDAFYSQWYSPPGVDGYRRMYVAKVLVGKYTKGRRGMKLPPRTNDPSNPGALYDSVVDNDIDPSVFVIFVDHQCYPEYLITFKT